MGSGSNPLATQLVTLIMLYLNFPIFDIFVGKLRTSMFAKFKEKLSYCSGGILINSLEFKKYINIYGI